MWQDVVYGVRKNFLPSGEAVRETLAALVAATTGDVDAALHASLKHILDAVMVAL